MVLRDRNHPCIYCWSIGNEIAEMTGVEAEVSSEGLQSGRAEVYCS